MSVSEEYSRRLADRDARRASSRGTREHAAHCGMALGVVACSLHGRLFERGLRPGLDVGGSGGVRRVGALSLRLCAASGGVPNGRWIDYRHGVARMRTVDRVGQRGERFGGKPTTSTAADSICSAREVCSKLSRCAHPHGEDTLATLVLGARSAERVSERNASVADCVSDTST